MPKWLQDQMERWAEEAATSSKDRFDIAKLSWQDCYLALLEAGPEFSAPWDTAVELADRACNIHFSDDKGRNSYAAEKYRIGFRNGYINGQCDQHSQDRAALAAMKAEVDRLREALGSVVAKSHSWLITQETGQIEKPIHDSYRNIAREALGAKK